MSIQLSTRVMHVKDENTGSYDTVDIIKGRDAIVDDELSTISTNPVQNKVITGELNDVKAQKITAPETASAGDFLVYNGTAWVAQTLASWQGGSY